ncbi:MAG: 5'/3'-nucleotidase SurE [Opitutales bacterium]|nr:5'/3'-nucleotidase SurE [Opitutales bacterium]
MKNRPVALLTNDDGIRSHFLHALAAAMARHFEVVVAAPAREQSWIGRALSRRREVSVESADFDGFRAWAIDGTPSDCVNIALAHLVETPPQVVVSGINIGYNTTLPLLYSSGTVAGALEGANWGLPALAVSQQVPEGSFEAITSAAGKLPPELGESLHAGAQLAAAHACRLVETPPLPLRVHNLNFPMPVSMETPWETTVPAHVRMPGLFVETAPGRYRFGFSEGLKVAGERGPTDREAIFAGRVSLSILNFSGVAESKGV